MWALGSLAVFWFSTSGGMYNIIRGIPLYILDKQGKMQLFLAGRSNQLGAEGFIMGSAYLLFSLCLASISFLAPSLSSGVARNGLAAGSLVAATYIIFKVFQAYNAKTGYHLRSYVF